MSHIRTSTIKRLMIALLGLSILLSACNLPQGTPTLTEMDLISTQAAETVAAQLTEISRPPATAGPSTATVVVPTQSTPAPTMALPTQTLLPNQLPSNTPLPPTQAPTPCDQAKFIKDITVPDNTVFAPGTAFTKTWRLRNVGSCTWTTSYTIVFTKGDQMGAPAFVPMPAPVPPGNSIDVSVPLVAPGTPGTYRGDWKLRNATNNVFGLGDEDKPFWVQIKVESPQASGLDFLALANSASWTSGTGNNPGVPLAYNGPDDDPNGVVKIKDSVRLEDGLVSGKVLLTYPRREENGYVSGVYTPYKVQPGDHLKGRLAFIANADGSCGNGNIVYQVSYKEGDTIQTLREGNKVCNRSQQSIDIDLVNLVGRTVQFIITVRANGPAVDDWLIWNSLRVVR